MSTITDSELATVYDTLTTLKGVISTADADGQLLSMVTDALQIVTSKIEQSKKKTANPVGASSLANEILANYRARKTKALFEMFHLS